MTIESSYNYQFFANDGICVNFCVIAVLLRLIPVDLEQVKHLLPAEDWPWSRLYQLSLKAVYIASSFAVTKRT